MDCLLSALNVLRVTLYSFYPTSLWKGIHDDLSKSGIILLNQVHTERKNIKFDKTNCVMANVRFCSSCGSKTLLEISYASTSDERVL